MKYSILFFFLFYLNPILLSAQKETSISKESVSAEDKASNRRFRGMVIAGFNMSQVDGDRMAGYYKFGFNGGVGVFAMIKKKFSISMELLYDMKGAKNKLSNSKYSYRNITLDYVDIPIMFNFHDKKIAIFGGGFSIGGLIRKKQDLYDSNGNKLLRYEFESKGNTYNLDIDEYNNNYKAYDFQIVGHATFLIKKKIGVQARFAYSLTGLGKVPFPDGNLSSGQQRNNVLSLRLFYMI